MEGKREEKTGFLSVPDFECPGVSESLHVANTVLFEKWKKKNNTKNGIFEGFLSVPDF